MAEDSSILASLTSYEKLKAYETGITPEVAAGMVSRASYSADGQRRLFETMIARDPDIRNAIQQRGLALLSAAWDFIPSDETVSEDAIVPVLRAGLPPPGFRKAMEHLALFRMFGYSIVEIEWGPGWEVKGLHPIPFAATDVVEGDISLVIGGVYQSVASEDFADRLIIVRADDFDPAGTALLRSVVGLWLTKVYLARDWRQYLERFGDPFKVGKYPKDAPKSSDGRSAQEVLLGALVELRRSGCIAIPEGTAVDLLADSRGDASKAFDLLWARCNQGIYTAIIGQSSTVEQGSDGSRASDEVRERTLDSLVEADAAMIAEALDEQLIAPIEREKVAGRNLVQTTYSWVRELPVLTRAEVFVKAKTAGIEFDHDAAREELGLKPPPAGQKPSPSVQPVIPPTDNEEDDEPDEGEESEEEFARRTFVQSFRSESGRAKDALDALSDVGGERLAAVLNEEIVKAVRKAVPAGSDLQTALDAFSETITEATLNPIATVFEEAILSARYNALLNVGAWVRKQKKRSRKKEAEVEGG